MKSKILSDSSFITLQDSMWATKATNFTKKDRGNVDSNPISIELTGCKVNSKPIPEISKIDVDLATQIKTVNESVHSLNEKMMRLREKIQANLDKVVAFNTDMTVVKK